MNATVKHPRLMMVCATCGSTAVTSDALATWNASKQEWECADTLQCSDCDDCGSECNIDQRDMAPQELALFPAPIDWESRAKELASALNRIFKTRASSRGGDHLAAEYRMWASTSLALTEMAETMTEAQMVDKAFRS